LTNRASGIEKQKRTALPSMTTELFLSTALLKKGMPRSALFSQAGGEQENRYLLINKRKASFAIRIECIFFHVVLLLLCWTNNRKQNLA
jgi:hypothetical protein